MGVHTIYEGFEMWFKDGAFIWVVFVFMAILGVVFLIEPLAAGICVVKGKILLLFSKDENGNVVFFKLPSDIGYFGLTLAVAAASLIAAAYIFERAA